MIYCANCGTEMPDGSLFCPECGAKTDNASNTPTAKTPPPVNPNPSGKTGTGPVSGNQTGKEIQHFLKVSLPNLTGKILSDPLDGTRKILVEIKEPAKIGIFCILICSLIISLLIYLRIPSELRQGMDFFSFFIRALFLPILGAFIVTFFSFLVKAIGRPHNVSFGNEILTGGIVSIGYAVFFILAFIMSYILQSNFEHPQGFRNFEESQGPKVPVFTLILLFSIFIYLFTITSNSLSQSLRSSGIKDAPAFYLSPFLIIISAYITIRIWIALFAGKEGMAFNRIFDVF